MGSITRTLVVISSFIMTLYVLQYTALFQQTFTLVSKNVVAYTKGNKEEAYVVRNGKLFGSVERADKSDSEYDQTTTSVYMKTVSKMTYFAMNASTTEQTMKRSLNITEGNTYTLRHPNTTLKTTTTQDVYTQFFARSRNVKQINCHAIFNRNVQEIRQAIYLNTLFKKEQKVEAYRYRNLTQNCTTFIKDKEYITNHLSDEERNFPIAYSILMYKYVEQMERLLRAIYRPQNVYCLHVDEKSNDDVYQGVAGIANCFENVFVASKRINVKWGKITVLEPELLCMEELWTRNKKWKYFINLTGQEFPLKTNFELVKILKAYNGSNDVETTRKWHRNRWANAPPPPYGIIPTKGAVHIAVNRGFVDYILHDNRSRDILAWVNKTRIPDETFFSTLNHNPKLGVPGSYKGFPETTSISVRTKPYIARFKNRLLSDVHRWPCQGKWIRGMCVFNTGDLPLLAERKELFANKFNLDYAPYAYGCMEELIFNRTRDEYLGKLSFDASWYASLGFVENKIE